MSKANAILQRCRIAGLHLERDGARLAIRPASRVTPALLEEIRAHKPALLALLDLNLPIAEVVPLDQDDARLLCNRVIREGTQARAWCMEQATRYLERYQADHLDCEAAAAMDFLLIQWRGKLKSSDREGQIHEIVAKLRMVEEDFANYCRKRVSTN